MKQEIKFFLSLRNKIVSVNDLYKAKIGYKGGNPYPIIYRNPKAVKLEQEIKDQLRGIDFNTEAPWIKETKSFKLLLQFVFKENIGKRDTSNQCKLIEDVIVSYFKEELEYKYDDSMHTEVHLYKSIIPKASDEYVCVSLSPSKFNTRFDITEKPEKIFLGGTCADSKWRDELIPELDKLGINYFNPIVSDWTPECQKIEDDEKENNCNTHLYLLTPEMRGMFSVAEIIDSAWKVKNSDTGFVIFGILGTEDEWGLDRYRSLKATVKMASEIIGSRGKAMFMNSVVDIVDILKTLSI